MSKTADTKLARKLQKRGQWASYSSCLREVQNALTKMSTLEVREAIQRGDLDPPSSLALTGKLRISNPRINRC
jgi:hypothetical protein